RWPRPAKASAGSGSCRPRSEASSSCRGCPNGPLEHGERFRGGGLQLTEAVARDDVPKHGERVVQLVPCLKEQLHLRLLQTVLDDKHGRDGDPFHSEPRAAEALSVGVRIA